MTDEAFDLDLAAAQLSANAGDVADLLQVLGENLQRSFGDKVSLTRKGGLLHRSDRIKAVRVEVGADTFRAEIAKAEATCSIAHSSGGITIRTERPRLDEWIRRLLAALQQEAAHSTAARQALEDILIGGGQ